MTDHEDRMVWELTHGYAACIYSCDHRGVIEWVDGPYTLSEAMEKAQELAEEDTRDTFDSDYAIRYYEVRGLKGTPVRYRLRIVRPEPFVQVEVLKPIRYRGVKP